MITDKQKRFCEEYLIDLNATQAAIRAGYSKKTAQEQSSRLLLNVMVQNYIAELKEERSKRVQLTQDEVLRELKAFAYSDITETILLTTEKIKDLPSEVRRLIVSYKKVNRRYGEDNKWEEETVELKFVDKIRVFDMLNRHIGFYEVDNQQKSNIVVDIADEP